MYFCSVKIGVGAYNSVAVPKYIRVYIGLYMLGLRADTLSVKRGKERDAQGGLNRKSGKRACENRLCGFVLFSLMGENHARMVHQSALTHISKLHAMFNCSTMMGRRVAGKSFKRLTAEWRLLRGGKNSIYFRHSECAHCLMMTIYLFKCMLAFVFMRNGNVSVSVTFVIGFYKAEL